VQAVRRGVDGEQITGRRGQPPYRRQRGQRMQDRRIDCGTCPAVARDQRAAVARITRVGYVLGVFGHQALVQLHGGTVGLAQELVHGKATIVNHDGRGIFRGLPADFLAGRYHSLAATSVPDVYEVSATAADGEVMAVRHRSLRIDGVQFHPESVLTPHGREIAKNFLEGTSA